MSTGFWSDPGQPAPEGAVLSLDDRRGPWPLHHAGATRRLEADLRVAVAAAPAGRSLMERAGLATARLALALHPGLRRVQLWCGPGDNGGDGWVAARVLQGLGIAVDLRSLDAAGASSPDLEQARRAGLAAGLRVTPGFEQAPTDLLIDALLGLGLARAPEGPMAAAIAHINAQALSARTPVLSIDLPSGLHPDTGACLGPACVRASHTLSMLTLKPGCFTHQGRDHAGRVWLAPLQAHGPDWRHATAWLNAAPEQGPRAHASHKGGHGDVLVVGGAEGMAGAAVLAAQAASAAGAGRVVLSPLHPAAAPLRPEIMTRPEAWTRVGDDWPEATVVAGCGGGQLIAHTLAALFTHAPRLVLDADGLNAVARNAALQAALVARAARKQATLLTPHPLEAARLLGVTTAAVQADRIAAAQALAVRFEATVLLKGSGSVIASPTAAQTQGQARGQAQTQQSATATGPCLNATGTGRLASGGTGDVLAGWIGGHWSSHPERPALRIASEAAWWHGRAAERAPGPPWLPLRALDLLEQMAQPAG